MVSFFQSKIVLVSFLIIVFNSIDKLFAMYVWTTTFYVIYLAHLLKNFYGEMRLYLQDDIKVESSICATGFGNPGGTVMLNSFLFVIMTY